MGTPVGCMGTTILCSFGVAPMPMVVLPLSRVMVSKRPMANILDSKPIVNIPPFVMCTSIANPMVATATAAAMGVLVPMPCVPVTPAPWTPSNPTVLVGKMPVQGIPSKTMCTWAGVINPIVPGQFQTMA